jgi:hypothetical protein
MSTPRARNPGVAGRLNLHKPMELSPKTQEAIDTLNTTFVATALHVTSMIEAQEEYDVGRLIACLDLIHQAKTTAGDALRIPAANKK